MRRLLTFIVIAHSQPLLAVTLYVNATAQGQNSGGSWDDAFIDLQDALAAAQAGDEVRVAAGTYTPDGGTGDRTRSFQLVCGVDYYGGFAGWENEREQRDWKKNQTILSGDLASNDGPQRCAEISNCCVAHDGLGCDDLTCQDIVCESFTYTYSECCHVGPVPNKWTDECAIRARIACCDLGGWNACENAAELVQVLDCDELMVFDGFTVQDAYYNFIRDDPAIRTGMGLRVERSKMHVANCDFHNNVIQAAETFDSDITFHQCRFTSSPNPLWGHGGKLVFTDCLFSDHISSGVDTSADDALFRNCTFQRNSFGARCMNETCTFENCRFVENRRAGLELNHATAMVLDSDFLGNYGGIQAYAAWLGARYCRFIGNRGTPMLDLLLSSGNVENSLFAQSYDLYSNKVVDLTSGNLNLDHCSFYGNMMSFPAPLQVYSDWGPASLRLHNSIVWGHDEFKPPLHWAGMLRAYGQEASISIDHSIVQGWNGTLGGEGNSGVSPQFIDPDGPDDIPGNDDDDFRLAPGSAGINAGDPDFVADSGETDLDGHARVLCGAVDIGAYEFGIGDFNCDQSIDLLDQATWNDCMTNPRPSAVRPGCEAFDFNADSDIDLADFAAQQRILISP